jgi:large subunit ribosomal protein L25
MGKGASRRLRQTGLVPAILYGAHKEPVALSLNENALLHNLETEAFFSHILTVKMPTGEEKAILKDLQRHPSRPLVLHVDLQRVSETEKIRVQVPLHFVNGEKSPGVREGGLITHTMSEVEIACLPKDLPEFIEVDLSGLAVNDILHLSDIKIPAGVELVELSHGTEHDHSVASVHLPRGAKEEAAGEEEGGEAAAEEGGE